MERWRPYRAAWARWALFSREGHIVVRAGLGVVACRNVAVCGTYRSEEVHFYTAVSTQHSFYVPYLVCIPGFCATGSTRTLVLYKCVAPVLSTLNNRVPFHEHKRYVLVF